MQYKVSCMLYADDTHTNVNKMHILIFVPQNTRLTTSLRASHKF